MAAEQRKLLANNALPTEQLMGAGASSRAAQLSITDPKICRSFLVGTCPHDLFTNTKQDLGPCPKIHSEPLKTEYEAAAPAQKQKWGFEYDYMRDLQKYIDECNRRIDVAQRRLEKTPDEIRQTNALLKQISDLSKSIESGLLEIQILGEQSEVSRAYDEFFRIRQAMQTKSDKEKELKALSDTSGPSGHQKLQVCDVCGAYLSRLDNDRRLADHFYGKMHLGYAQMRKTYEAFPKEMKRSRPMVDDGDHSPAARGYDGGYGDGGYGRGGYGGRGGGRGGFRASEHTEEQKKHIYDNLPEDQKQKQTYTEWAKEVYNDQYEKWMPWLEDQYLKWFGKGDNKASYATKDTLDKTKVSGISQVDQIQGDVNNLIGNQLGENGFLAPIGNMAGKEGINRVERGGKDEAGTYGGPASSYTDPMIKNAKGAGEGIVGGAQSAGEGLVGGAQSAGSTLGGGVKSAGGMVGGMFGGKEETK
ncbi:putative U1 snRNP protein [Rutstroemia sp. NJR-2017a BBW]|nr:putative U1 snRNP protein [Rutstroemia sp. NJR-2017a BBW]